MKGLVLLLVVVCAACAGGWQAPSTSAGVDAHKEVVRRFYEAYNQGNWDALDALVAPGYVHRTPSTEVDLAAFKQAGGSVRAGMPDYRITVEEIIADGNRVAVRLTGRGTHRGSFYGEPATGRSVVSHGMVIHRLEHGRIVEGWELSDMHPSFQELGAVGEPGEL